MKYESHIEHWKSKNPCANSNPNFKSSVQGDVLSIANPNPIWNPKSLVRGNLDKMRGKSLGYNSFPCSIFLNLKSKIGEFAFRDSKVKEDWTLECPEICTRQNVNEGMGLKMPFGDGRILLEMGLEMPSKTVC